MCNSLFLTVHLLFNAPTNRCNRDGNNRPKTINYNGVERQRWSSQCMKRVIRERFNYKSDISKEELVDKIKNYKCTDDPSYVNGESYNLPKSFINDVCFGIKKEAKGENEVAVRVSLKELWNLKNTGTWEDFPDLDILIFGRMYASKDDKDAKGIDKATKDIGMGRYGCCQVAHAISAQKVHIVNDYTTVGSSLRDKSGAISILDSWLASGSIMCVSATLDVKKLIDFGCTEERAVKAAIDWVYAFYDMDLPSGSNGTFTKVYPDYCHVLLGNTQPINSSNAYYNPLDSDSSIEDAIKALSNKIHYNINRARGMAKHDGRDFIADEVLFDVSDETSVEKLNHLFDPYLSNLH